MEDIQDVHWGSRKGNLASAPYQGAFLEAREDCILLVVHLEDFVQDGVEAGLAFLARLGFASSKDALDLIKTY